MIRLGVEQGSMEWLHARLGIPTASRFADILTPKTLKLSKQAGRYRNRLLAEWLLGYPLDDEVDGGWLERGRNQEEEARRWYEFDRGLVVETCGLVLRDDLQVAGSPDGLVGDDGILEIKCPALHTHVGYLLEGPPDYRSQVQGYLYLTGRKWADVLSYSPQLPSVVERVERDEAYIAALGEALDGFIADLQRCRERLAEFRAPSAKQFVDDLRAGLVADALAAA